MGKLTFEDKKAVTESMIQIAGALLKEMIIYKRKKNLSPRCSIVNGLDGLFLALVA